MCALHFRHCHKDWMEQTTQTPQVLSVPWAQGGHPGVQQELTVGSILTINCCSLPSHMTVSPSSSYWCPSCCHPPQRCARSDKGWGKRQCMSGMRTAPRESAPSYRNQLHLFKNSYWENNTWICNNCCSSLKEQHIKQSCIWEEIPSLLCKNLLLSSRKLKFWKARERTLSVYKQSALRGLERP